MAGYDAGKKDALSRGGAVGPLQRNRKAEAPAAKAALMRGLDVAVETATHKESRSASG